jgi:hypothetical protein
MLYIHFLTSILWFSDLNKWTDRHDCAYLRHFLAHYVNMHKNGGGGLVEKHVSWLVQRISHRIIWLVLTVVVHVKKHVVSFSTKISQCITVHCIIDCCAGNARCSDKILNHCSDYIRFYLKTSVTIV